MASLDAPGRQVGRDDARFVPGEADLDGGSGDVRRMLEQQAEPDIAAHESGDCLEQAQLHPDQRAVRVMHGHEAETHEQEGEAEPEVVVVVHAAEQHREEHRAVRDAEPRGQDVDTLATQLDGVRVRALSAPDPRARAPLNMCPQVPQQPAHCAQGTATAASTC